MESALRVQQSALFESGRQAYSVDSVTPVLLIDAIVRQTMVLVAALATSAGNRAPLASVADQVFTNLVRELKQQGLTNRVIADMFGIALRTYHQRVARLSMSRTNQGESLWSSVYSFVRDSGPVLRAEVFERFERDDEGILRAIIHDLVESGLVARSGRGAGIRLTATSPVERTEDHHAQSAHDALLLVAIHDRGPISREDLEAIVPLDESELTDALARLVRQGAVREVTLDGTPQLTCDSCVIPLGAEAGWEAAVFDHYQALVTALVTKLSRGERRSSLSESTGGSTFTVDLWEGHPMADEALGFLKIMREAGMDLRRRVREHNDEHARPHDARPLRIVSYVGQSVKEGETNDE